jgi:hypothetical protein
MKRLYEREGAAFVPMGWVCPVCQFMTSDEKERQAEEIPEPVEEEDLPGIPEICIDCKAWATCKAKTPESRVCKKTRAKIEMDLRSQNPLVQTPGELQAAFDRAGINAEVVERPPDKLTVAYCRSKKCKDLEQRVPPNGKGWQCRLTGKLPSGGGMGYYECKFCKA